MNEIGRTNIEATPGIEMSKQATAARLEKVCGADTARALGFINTMAARGMPGATKLYTELPVSKEPSFISKWLLSRKTEVTGGASVFGYPIGALMVTPELQHIGAVYLCPGGVLMALETVAGRSSAVTSEIATLLDRDKVVIGRAPIYDETIVYTSDLNPGQTEFHKMTMAKRLEELDAYCFKAEAELSSRPLWPPTASH